MYFVSLVRERKYLPASRGDLDDRHLQLRKCKSKHCIYEIQKFCFLAKKNILIFVIAICKQLALLILQFFRIIKYLQKSYQIAVIFPRIINA